MNSLDTLTVVAAVAGSCAVALIGWLLGARDARRSRPEARASKRWRAAVSAVVFLGAVASSIAAPVIAVFWILVALNAVLGERENIPFSTYSMFSRPSTKAWALRFEDSDGALIAIGKIGLGPVIVQKRFETELNAARRGGVEDLGAARRSAATVLAAEIELRRPSHGPLATSPITIVLIEYTLESGQVLTVRTPIMDTTP